MNASSSWISKTCARVSIMSVLNYAEAGRGFKMSFPVSSQSMAKSYSTSRVLWPKIVGAITLLCAPKRKRTTIKSVDRLKKGWFIKESKNDTSAVVGSPNQQHAPTATHTEVTSNKILHLKMKFLKDFSQKCYFRSFLPYCGRMCRRDDFSQPALKSFQIFTGHLLQRHFEIIVLPPYS